MYDDLENVLVSEQEIKERIKALGREISDFYDGEELTVIAIINGAILFTADLLREISCPVRLDCIRVSSYKNDVNPVVSPEVVDTIRLDLTGRHLLLIDDILDTGRTIHHVAEMMKTLEPASIRTCVLLEKKGRREIHFHADHVGFEIPDKFVVGYGLDFAERYRNLPVIGTLRPELQNPPNWA